MTPSAASSRREWITYRVSGPELSALADESES